MTDIQAQPKSVIVYTLHNVQKPLGICFQYIFQHNLHTEIVFQKVPPEKDRLLCVPNGIVDPGIIAAVDNHLRCAVGLCEFDGLPVAFFRQCPRFFIDGAGKQLIKGSMKDFSFDAP